MATSKPSRLKDPHKVEVPYKSITRLLHCGCRIVPYVLITWRHVVAHFETKERMLAWDIDCTSPYYHNTLPLYVPQTNELSQLSIDHEISFLFTIITHLISHFWAQPLSTLNWRFGDWSKVFKPLKSLSLGWKLVQSQKRTPQNGNPSTQLNMSTPLV